jgi:hypothetical protein
MTKLEKAKELIGKSVTVTRRIGGNDYSINRGLVVSAKGINGDLAELTFENGSRDYVANGIRITVNN